MDSSEFRCGYEIVPKQKKIWDVEIDLLKTFLEVCNRHNIKVQVFAGTLLGAVRHGGFIPWDDDVDLCLDRKNFDKLLSLPKDTFPAPYFLQTPYNDLHYYTPFARFRNSNTTGIIKWNNSSEYNNGIYIDVFVLDGKPPTIIERLHIKLLAYASILINLKNGSSPKKIKRSLRSSVASFVSSLVNLNMAIGLHQFLLSLFTPFVAKLTLMSHPKSFINKYWLYKSELNDTVFLDFEGLKVPAPRSYDVVLSRIYGDYMTFPPPCERGKWHEGVIYFDPDTSYLETYRRGFVWNQ